MQGGIDPELPATAYFDLVTAVKQRVPEMHVHAFSPMEVVNGTARTGLSIEDFLIKAREAGLGSLPGTAAEILDDEVRWVLTKGKLPTRTWIEVVSTAHRVGIPTTSTMMYGHVDNPRHWVNHLRVLSRIQDETSGFTEFVPLPFVHTSAPIYLAGVARPGPTLRDNLAVHAMARILLHGRIRNIQTSWVKLGVDGTRAMLRAGANDVGGTLMEETISRMAGSEHGSAKTVEELVEIGAGIGRPVVERTTIYADADPLPARRAGAKVTVSVTSSETSSSPLDVTTATLYVVARNKLRTSAEGAEAQVTGGGSREAKFSLMVVGALGVALSLAACGDDSRQRRRARGRTTTDPARARSASSFPTPSPRCAGRARTARRSRRPSRRPVSSTTSRTPRATRRR